ncbi:LysM repeat protein/GH25 family lysozyme M1 (1,4-beta-N-acetylmuramidase) [Saccharopolyspora lacisalsi]|uniref:LysM repeat protein/GH25 family lysozyme M1 (1,4-beta-N-acetylmuramidase) n=1 Tax=Halosaccharopolyspora lacisalsi TaxID=1000566 RepID=A0A839E3P1_9PSEU|nr:LysM peptidoglycan-binding domain-containing protein [Halosaccharopolyspora lacisalsi]MBA8827903.1 LysM repeat protein/GH25 family lysozyme M1 (1,4-beta-N-acetylmuramidase) [Halosaccharopolyspora lacisalsi]
MDYGIDISHYQQVTNWDAVAGNNIAYCSIKVTEGESWSDDAAWHHIDGCDSAGILPGGYHFARPGEPSAQVQHFAGQLEHHRLTGGNRIWPMLDIEDPAIPNPDGFIDQFVRELRHATGVPGVLVYANTNWFTHRLNPWWARADVLLWAAHYNGEPGNPGWSHERLALHQHTNEGQVPGVVGHVDRNATVGTWRLPAFTIGQGAPPPAPAPEPPAQDPAPAPSPEPEPRTRNYEVRAGDTVSGIARRFGTTVEAIASASGLADPDEIQVGQILKVPHGPGSTYMVQPGDTIIGIASQLGVDAGHLVRANNLGNPDHIVPGQVLTY